MYQCLPAVRAPLRHTVRALHVRPDLWRALRAVHGTLCQRVPTHSVLQPVQRALQPPAVQRAVSKVSGLRPPLQRPVRRDVPQAVQGMQRQ